VGGGAVPSGLPLAAGGDLLPEQEPATTIVMTAIDQPAFMARIRARAPLLHN
jgi:hypothetical protein